MSRTLANQKQLARKDLDETMRRPLRKHCLVAKFCSLHHLQKCKANARSSTLRGGREALTQSQCIKLFQTLVTFSPWAAMLSLLQLFIADRADCTRQCCWGWLSGLEPGGKSQSMITIPKANKKTVARFSLLQTSCGLQVMANHSNRPAVRHGQQLAKQWAQRSFLYLLAFTLQVRKGPGTNQSLKGLIWTG